MLWLTGSQKNLVANIGGWQKKPPMLPVFQGLSPLRHYLMGVVNITPDSFSDGGLYNSPQAAIEQARRLADDGADIIDLGAESTRPGAEAVSAEEELSKLLPVLESLVEGWRDDPAAPVVSVDTFKAAVARCCLEQGALVVNDVSGGTFDPAILEVLGHFKPAYVLGHSPARPREMQQNPHYDNVLDELSLYFEQRLNALIKAGLPEENIAIDPCIGFGKLLEHNLAILNGSERFLSFGRPLFMAFSRKSMFRQLLHIEASDVQRLDAATQASLALLSAKYPEACLIHRVHDVRGAGLALHLARVFSSSASYSIDEGC